jgi:hypothetical protein
MRALALEVRLSNDSGRLDFGLGLLKSLSGFYETAVECKDIALVFLLLGFFVFAVVFAVSFAGTTRTLRRIHLGLLYALEESRQGLGA